MSLGWSSGSRRKDVGPGSAEKGLRAVLVIFYFSNNNFLKKERERERANAADGNVLNPRGGNV